MTCILKSIFSQRPSQYGLKSPCPLCKPKLLIRLQSNMACMSFEWFIKGSEDRWELPDSRMRKRARAILSWHEFL